MRFRRRPREEESEVRRNKPQPGYRRLPPPFGPFSSRGGGSCREGSTESLPSAISHPEAKRFTTAHAGGRKPSWLCLRMALSRGRVGFRACKAETLLTKRLRKHDCLDV